MHLHYSVFRSWLIASVTCVDMGHWESSTPQVLKYHSNPSETELETSPAGRIWSRAEVFCLCCHVILQRQQIRPLIFLGHRWWRMRAPPKKIYIYWDKALWWFEVICAESFWTRGVFKWENQMIGPNFTCSLTRINHSFLMEVREWSWIYKGKGRNQISLWPQNCAFHSL